MSGSVHSLLLLKFNSMEHCIIIRNYDLSCIIAPTSGNYKCLTIDFKHYQKTEPGMLEVQSLDG